MFTPKQIHAPTQISKNLKYAVLKKSLELFPDTRTMQNVSKNTLNAYSYDFIAG